MSNVTHELRTPMAAISSLSESLAYQEDVSKEEYQEVSEIIFLEIQRLSKMVTEILELSKFDQDAMYITKEEFDVNVIITDIERLFSSRSVETGIKFEVNTINQVIDADYDKIKQVLINLIENAFLYTRDEIQISAAVKNEKVRITVADNGHGLNFEQKQLIFSRFFRTDESRARNSGGTGLGLSIAKEIVDRHQGNIYVQSELNIGSEFIVELPIKGVHSE